MRMSGALKWESQAQEGVRPDRYTPDITWSAQNSAQSFSSDSADKPHDGDEGFQLYWSCPRPTFPLLSGACFNIRDIIFCHEMMPIFGSRGRTDRTSIFLLFTSSEWEYEIFLSGLTRSPFLIRSVIPLSRGGRLRLWESVRRLLVWVEEHITPKGRQKGTNIVWVCVLEWLKPSGAHLSCLI